MLAAVAQQCGDADADAVAKLDQRADRKTDERRDRRVRVSLAEERRLELRVGAVERRVVPVEAAARFRGGDEERKDDGAEERVNFIGACAGVRAREDPRSRLAEQIVDGETCVVALGERAPAGLEERPHERPVLVQRGPAERGVLLERERQLGTAVELRAEHAEGAEAKAAQ